MNSIISTVFTPVSQGECEICSRPAAWKYIKGPIELKDGSTLPTKFDDLEGELWCERCRKLYDLEELRGKVEEIEKELAKLP